MIVCLCEALDDRAIDAAIDRGCRSVSDLARDCGAGGDCGACCLDLARRLRDRLPLRAHRAAAAEDMGGSVAAK